MDRVLILYLPNKPEQEDWELGKNIFVQYKFPRQNLYWKCEEENKGRKNYSQFTDLNYKIENVS